MENSNQTDLTRPPWSGQSVKKWIRVLAWVWVVLLVLFTPLAFWLAIQDGIVKENIPGVLAAIAGELYMTVLFAHVAFRGRAPVGWFPWDRSSIKG
ncbi:hypothetical protein [Teredinibacter purpureus]|uniref:hypothetical protein n=1 Tax=Teredinibacter purpureus TaxID=2731756 RepID=UPI0013C48155|nr:hypothetical protein [Teredinibacter purpureus]